MVKKRILAGFLALALVLAALLPAFRAQAAEGGPIIIRDTEIESAIKEWTKPLIIAAGLDPSSVHFIIVQNDEINAFVAGGQNIFIYTGLIEKTANPGELIGVIAHELGHIRGGHLVRMQIAAEHASYEAIAGMVLGVGAAILSGNGAAAAVGSMAGHSQAMRGFLAFSRVQEASADQSALYEFAQAHMNPTGFLTFMQKLENQELLPPGEQDEYVRNHPLTRNRIEYIRQGVEKSPYKNVPWPPAWVEQHKRMLAKLTGFISPDQVAFKYDAADQSIPARYARTIAAYRQNKVAESLAMVDALLKSEPKNPYFYELKGQMLMDYGRLPPAITALKQAVALKKNAPLIHILYAQALIADSENGGKKTQLAEAITQLNRVRQNESHTPAVQHWLAMAYGYSGNEPEARLHLAQEALLQRNFDEARRLATQAAQGLKKDSQSWLRAQDILAYIDTVKKPKDGNTP